MDILIRELHQQPQIFYSAELKICPLKTLKQHQCGDLVSSKGLDFGGELQQPEKWKSLKEQQKKQIQNHFRIVNIIEKHNIPKFLGVKSDQIPLKYVTARHTTMPSKN